MADVEITEDPTVLLIATVAALADMRGSEFDDQEGTYSPSLGPLKPLRRDPAVRRMRRLERRGFAYSLPAEWALCLDPQTLTSADALPASVLEVPRVAPRLDRLSADLLVFRERPEWHAWLADTAATRTALVDRAKQLADPGAPERVAAFYGTDVPDLRMLVTLPYRTYNFGFEHAGAHVVVSSPEQHDPNIAGSRAEQGALVLHELSHPYVNALVAAHWAEFGPLEESLYEPIRPWMEHNAYGEWQITLYEHLIRASVCRMVADTDGVDVGTTCVQWEKLQGFWYVPLLYEALGRYEADRARWPTLDAFVPELVAALSRP